MNPETLAAELDREPFIPLRLHLSDGRTLEVRNPGLCYIARLALYLFRADRPRSALAAVGADPSAAGDVVPEAEGGVRKPEAL